MATNSTRTESREQALRYLYEYDMQPDLTASSIISAARSERGENPSPYATLLFKTAYNHLDELDEIIRAHARNWDFRRISKVTLAVLRLSICEYAFLPEHPRTEVIVNEALELARKYGNEDAIPFINGVLGAALNPPEASS